jgi:NADP-dependent 3-hydroxy acid dehydrogenase YdfG
MSLKNKVIVITGASQGLGEALAYKVAELGAIVILVARTQKLLKKVQQHIIKNGGQADMFVCDIRDLQAVETTVKKILTKYPNVDILVNNAGVWTDNELEKTRPELRQIALDTNTLGNIQFTKTLLPHFEAKNGGYIFNVISSSGMGGIEAGHNALWQTYGASKWALTGFTRALKDALASTKIKVSGFFPGGFESNLYETGGRKDAHMQFWMMKTEDIADIIVFALTRPDDVLIEELVVTKVK